MLASTEEIKKHGGLAVDVAAAIDQQYNRLQSNLNIKWGGQSGGAFKQTAESILADMKQVEGILRNLGAQLHVTQADLGRGDSDGSFDIQKAAEPVALPSHGANLGALA